MPDSPPPETLAWLRQCAALDGAAYPQVLLHLLDRVEALEQESTCKQSLQVPPTPEAAPEATDAELRQIWEGAGYVEDALRTVYNLGRQHGAAQPPAAQPAPVAAPAGGLVERVALAIGGEGDHPANWTPKARAAIREVAAWLRSELNLSVADLLLEQECKRNA
jgi:hypothetical protein